MQCGLVPQLQTPLHCPLLYRWAGRVIGAAAVLFFLALLNKGADPTINQLRDSQEWQGQFDSNDIHAVHATCAPFPSKP